MTTSLAYHVPSLRGGLDEGLLHAARRSGRTDKSRSPSVASVANSDRSKTRAAIVRSTWTSSGVRRRRRAGVRGDCATALRGVGTSARSASVRTHGFPRVAATAGPCEQTRRRRAPRSCGDAQRRARSGAHGRARGGGGDCQGSGYTLGSDAFFHRSPRSPRRSLREGHTASRGVAEPRTDV